MIINGFVPLFVISVILLCGRLKLGCGDVGREVIRAMGTLDNGEIVEFILDEGPTDVRLDPHSGLLILV